jgi:hypothetical protein
MQSQNMYCEGFPHVGVTELHEGPISTNPVPQHPLLVCTKPVRHKTLYKFSICITQTKKLYKLALMRRPCTSTSSGTITITSSGLDQLTILLWMIDHVIHLLIHIRIGNLTLWKNCLYFG